MIKIREEQPEDIQAIREVNVRAFGQPQESEVVDKLRENCNDRFGFVPARRFGIKCEWEVPEETFMILALNTSEIDGVSGMARYRPEFADAM